MSNIKITSQELGLNYQLFIENVNDLVCVIDPINNFKIDLINERVFNRLLGYSFKDLMERSFLDFVYLDDVEKTIKLLKKGGDDTDKIKDIRINHKDGTYIWAEIKVNNYIDDENRKKILLILKDISEKKDLENRLKESEERFRQFTGTIPEIRFWKLFTPKKYEEALRSSYEMLQMVMENIPEYIFWKDVNFVYLGCNDNYARLLGIESADAIIGKTDKDLMWDKESVKKFNEMERNVMKAVKPEFHALESWISKNKEQMWFDANRISLKDSTEAVMGILVTYEDITKRKKAEEDLIKAGEEIKISEEKYRHLFNNSPNMIILMDSNGTLIDVNTAFINFTGYKKEDILYKNYLELNYYPPNLPQFLNDFKEIFSKEHVEPVEVKLQGKGENLRWVNFQASIVEIKGERLIQIIMEDINERKLAEEKLKESEKKLREQNIELKKLDELKNDFITIAAHELKTPLVSVGGYVDLILMREIGLNPEMKEDLERVLNNVKRLEDHVNKIMDVMKIDAKKILLNFKKENIYEIIQNCVSDLYFQIKEKNLKMNIDIDKDIHLSIDAFRLSQVFSNLLSNAVKFTYINGKIEISVKKKENHYLFEIKDDGRGLTLEEVNQLFEKFVTIGQDPEQFSMFDKGSGLGLYISKGIIEAHGGKIWVESEGRNKGSTFYFTLPIKKDVSSRFKEI